MTRAIERSLGLSIALLAATCAPAEVPPTASARSTAAAPSASASLATSASARDPASIEPPFTSNATFSLLVRGGEVVDGSGKPRRSADVLVREGRIAFVGRVDPGVHVERVIDAKGALVTPGFIDMHSHFDPKGNVEAALAQGITLVVVGQDGDSPAPRIGPWLDGFTTAPPRINVVTLVGHVTARNAAGLGAKAPLGAADRDKLAAAVSTALDEGAFGLSTGLEYDPARLADAAELAAMAKPVGDRGGMIMSHLRSEDDDKIDAALDELIAQARASGARAHVSHLKVVYGKGKARAEAILHELDEARASGVSVTADMYPYTASYTTIAILFPDYARNDYTAAKAHRAKEVLTFLHDRVEKRGGPEGTLFGSGDLAGKTLAEVAKSRGVPFEKVLFDLGPTGAHAAYFVMDEELQSRLFLDPFVSVGTDGGGGSPHPRGFGSFAKVIEEKVVAKKVLSIEEAVRKMTSLGAGVLGIEKQRGCLEVGCAADLLVFDPSEIHTRADYLHPFEIAEGMRFVVVNGKVEREGAKPTSLRAGVALRPARSKGSKNGPQ